MTKILNMIKRLKKIIVLIFLILLPVLTVFPQFTVYFIYKGSYYIDFKLINNEEIPIEPFNVLKIIDQSQTHRVLLSSLEKSRLSSLFFVGDHYEFNNIALSMIDMDLYKIYDKINNFGITFSIGSYDNIIIHTAVNFGIDDKYKEFDILDMIASSFSVKLLLKRITGKMEKEELKIDNRGQEKEEIKEEYQNFINQLKSMKSDVELMEYLTKYVKLNFNIKPDFSLKTDWINPQDLYFYKEGDYKSCAFFYFYTLQQCGIPVRSYLISHIKRKDEEEIEKMHYIFFSKNRDKIHKIEIEYNMVNSDKILLEFSDNYENSKLKKPPDIFFYEPPSFENSIFIITAKINEKWIYTTGINWVDVGIYVPERVCSHYTKNGCYYTYLGGDREGKSIDIVYYIFNNIPFKNDDFTWDVFFPAK